ncbi:MAG: cytidylate kinase-like family protein [Verrucomicrobia bacterium]|jgi:cytidylate kinase|nr:cytidylate kinase-like family protein [Verrucomicrobiota bacterium]
MSLGIEYDKCLSFINCQITPGQVRPREGSPPKRLRAVTISRESGSGAHAIATQLATRLQAREKRGRRPWTVFDKDLVTRVLEDHHFPARMAEFIPEDRMSELQDAVQELFNLRPPSWTIIQHTSETMLRLVELGNVILIGRAGNIVTQTNPEVLHIRLVGSEATRTARIAEARQVSQRTALQALRREDRGRARYVRKYFGHDIQNPLLYHATFNTDLVSTDSVVNLLETLVEGGPHSE